ncbi:hypothetical protein BH11ARM1_BH11ARM1_09300 [soil metagenome]
MLRWRIAFILVLLASVFVVSFHQSDPDLLKDSDTHVLLDKIREVHDPLHWFAGDWPLQNHFYRPVSTLSFELDNALYGDNAAGYGWTNALLAGFCVLLLFWFCRELTDKPAISAGAAVLYAVWLSPVRLPLPSLAIGVAVLCLVLGLIRHGRHLSAWLPGFLLWIFIADEMAGKSGLFDRLINWLPGRTASVMAVFALISLAAYARYERVSAGRRAVVLTPLDPPATRSTSVVSVSRWPWIWAILSLIGLALSLGSYEQAVMVPSLLLAVAVTFKINGRSPRWGWQVPFWALLVGYLVLRRVLLPQDVSQYQMQALRHGPGVWIDIASYAIPAGYLLYSLNLLVGQWVLLLNLEPWLEMLAVASNVGAVRAVWSRWKEALPPYLMSILAFLPMAWLQHFNHYHLFPMAFRTLFAVVLVGIGLRWLITAASPPTQQAPLRLDPAPGSLPRR